MTEKKKIILVRVSRKTKERLDSLGTVADTMDDVVGMLLDEHDEKVNL